MQNASTGFIAGSFSEFNGLFCQFFCNAARSGKSQRSTSSGSVNVVAKKHQPKTVELTKRSEIDQQSVTIGTGIKPHSPRTLRSRFTMTDSSKAMWATSADFVVDILPLRFN